MGWLPRTTTTTPPAPLLRASTPASPRSAAGAALARLRALVRAADPGVVEEWKWNNPVWSLDGLICTGEAYKGAVKATFARGASLPDPARLFNASLEGQVRRAIDIREGDTLDAAAFQALVRAAVALNRAGRGRNTG